MHKRNDQPDLGQIFYKIFLRPFAANSLSVAGSIEGQNKGVPPSPGSFWSVFGKPQGTWKISGLINRDFSGTLGGTILETCRRGRIKWPIMRRDRCSRRARDGRDAEEDGAA